MSKISQNKILIKLIITFILGILSFCIGFKKCELENYEYIENNSVDYKVYLKENTYFDTPYLEENKTYITSLIDYIDASFCYDITFPKEVSGSINYQIIAEIIADKDGNEIGNYWTKRYELTELETEEIKSKSQYLINLNNKIDYNKYNEILNQFIKEYNLQAESTLKVALVVTGDVKEDKTKDEIGVSSEISLNVPLSKKSIEGKIVIENNNEKKDIIQNKDRLENVRNVVKTLFIIDLFVFCYYLYEYIEDSKIKERKMSYRQKIQKIIDEYDGIIARVENANIDKYVRIDVRSIDDLINVYNSTREPINLYCQTDKSIFFIINNSSCYVYTIIKEVKRYENI